jgi:DNA-directed RNA polymerase specialized sigma24 family protein
MKNEDAIVAAAVAGEDYAAIAQAFGVTRQAVSCAVHRARKAGNPIPKRSPGRAGKAAQILEMAARGLRPGEISERLGMAVSWPSAVITKARLAGADLPDFSRRHPPELRERVLAMAVAGSRTREIATETGLSRDTVWEMVARARRDGVPGIPASYQGVSAEHAEALALGMRGVSPKEIATLVGWPAAAVSVALSRARSAGAAIPLFGGGRKDNTPEVLRLHADGLDPEAIAAGLGCKLATVARILRTASKSDAASPMREAA